MLEAHYAAPMIGAVLNPINIRLDAPLIAFCLEHGEAKLLLADREFHATIAPALEQARRASGRSSSTSPTPRRPARRASAASSTRTSSPPAIPAFAYPGPEDEWDSICLLYTSGTTGNPKGAVYSHRGAYLGALANALTFKLDHESRYLWTLPMFHCSGWTFTWAVTAAGGTHVCLRKVEPKRIFDRIAEHRVTHMCGAPIVLNMLVHAPAEAKRPLPLRPKVATGGAAPPAIVIERMEAMGFEVLHLYGTTESYGPSTYCAPMPEWQDAAAERALRAAWRARASPSPLIEDMIVADPETLAPVPRDGATDRRDHAARQHADEGLPQERGGDRRGVRRRALPLGRPRRLARRRLHRGQGPLQGHHHLRRREHLLARGRGGALPPPAGDGGGRGRAARREMGRDPVRVRHPEARRGPRHGRGHHRLLPRQHGPLQGAAHGRVRAAAEDLDRQDPEVRAARPGQGPG